MGGRIFDKPYKAHRVIWAMCHGGWPIHGIDHIDGDRTNNRFENLRDVTQSKNMRNSSIRSDNTSGVVGVYLEKKSGTWYAQIKTGGTVKHLGQFPSFEDAVAARAAAEIKYKYHKHHGRDEHAD